MPKFLGTRDIFPEAPRLGRGNSGDQTGQANPFRVFGVSASASLRKFRVAEEEGGNLNPNQATSTILVRIIQQSCKRSKLISMCAGATISFLQHSHRNP